MTKRALCVGINDYPGTNMDLAGCVNDAMDWHALLGSRGYSVTSLRDAEGTRAGIVAALEALIASGLAGDSLVFTFSGHGSWLPDDDHDEPDQRDEVLCPHDVMEDQYLVDDDLHAIFSKKMPAVRLTMIADSCHSGTVTRYAESTGAPGSVAVRARFLPPSLFARGDTRIEQAIDRAARMPAPTKLSYPALLFAGCQDSEFSYDTAFGGRPNGAFTRTAIDALRDTSPATPRAWYDAIRKALPSQALPQTPQLFGSLADADGPLL